MSSSRIMWNMDSPDFLGDSPIPKKIKSVQYRGKVFSFHDSGLPQVGDLVYCNRFGFSLIYEKNWSKQRDLFYLSCQSLKFSSCYGQDCFEGMFFWRAS